MLRSRKLDYLMGASQHTFCLNHHVSLLNRCVPSFQGRFHGTLEFHYNCEQRSEMSTPRICCT